MPTITLAISKELREKMIAQEDINWSGVARKAIEDKLKSIAILRKIEMNVDKAEKIFADEKALEEWNSPEEEKAWKHLQKET